MKSYQNYKRQDSKKYTQIEELDKINELNDTSRRHLTVWSNNCCPNTNICGVFFEDCCTLTQNNTDCYWYFFCS